MNGFQPLCAPQATSPPPRPNFMPQLRPMTDPFAVFGHNAQLKLRVKEALLAERCDIHKLVSCNVPTSTSGSMQIVVF